MRSLALSLCCFLSSSLAMRAGNSSSNTQIFTACPELLCLLLPYQLPLDFGTKLDTSNHSRTSMIFMSKQKVFFCAYSGWNSSYSKMVCGSCTYLHTSPSGEGAGLHGACHSQVLMLPEHSVTLRQMSRRREGGLNREGTINAVRTILCLGRYTRSCCTYSKPCPARMFCERQSLWNALSWDVCALDSPVSSTQAEIKLKVLKGKLRVSFLHPASGFHESGKQFF